MLIIIMQEILTEQLHIVNPLINIPEKKDKNKHFDCDLLSFTD